MLSDRGRAILFWFTISMIAVVAVVGVTTMLRACATLTSRELPLAISPGAISLCPGERHQFTVDGGVEVTWGATGGTISEGGRFTAGDAPGDYTVLAARRDQDQTAEAIVHIVACSPTATHAPSPTPSLPPTATPEAEATAPADADGRGDVGTYETGAAVETPPAGVDIRAASVGIDLRVALQRTEGVPRELTGWAAEEEMLTWISLWEPVPDPPQAYADWVVALDVDGDVETGRPAGSARINPDLGTEAAVGVRYDPADGGYVPYVLVWDPAQEGWTEKLEGVRYRLDESRTLIGLAFSLESVAQTVADISDVTLVPEAVRGRAAALSYVGEQAVIDFYPDRPE